MTQKKKFSRFELGHFWHMYLNLYWLTHNPYPKLFGKLSYSFWIFYCIPNRANSYIFLTRFVLEPLRYTSGSIADMDTNKMYSQFYNNQPTKEPVRLQFCPIKLYHGLCSYIHTVYSVYFVRCDHIFSYVYNIHVVKSCSEGKIWRFALRWP